MTLITVNKFRKKICFKENLKSNKFSFGNNNFERD